MKNSMLAVAALTALLLAGDGSAAEKPATTAPADAPKAMPGDKRELLSDHQTVAKFTGIQFQRCRGLTALCPDRCGGSGDFASFEVVAYLSYKKPGEYGDPKATTFTFQIEDNLKNLKVPKELADVARGLQPGDSVLLNWKHEYVTKREEGGSSSFPERPVTKLEKVTPQEADELARKAAK